jgi:hypothetical protein
LISKIRDIHGSKAICGIRNIVLIKLVTNLNTFAAMSSQIRPVPSIDNAQLVSHHPRCKILSSRNQYSPCHIQVPDSPARLAAIAVDSRYYSFFKLVSDRTKTLQIAAKLVYRGDDVAITQTPKGDVIWIYEPEAQTGSSIPVKTMKKQSDAELWRILDSERDYQPCQIRVPDMAKPLAAICVDRQYYSFMRMVRNEAQAIELVERLAKKGNAAMITVNGRSCAIWVLESDATPN